MDLRRLPGALIYVLGSLERLLTRETLEYAWFRVDDLRRGKSLTLPLMPWPHPRRYLWMRNPGANYVDVRTRQFDGKTEMWALVSRPKRTLALFARAPEKPGLND